LVTYHLRWKPIGIQSWRAAAAAQALRVVAAFDGMWIVDLGPAPALLWNAHMIGQLLCFSIVIFLFVS